MDFDLTTETITPTLTTLLLTIGSTGALELPNGTTAQRPGSATSGAIRWNNNINVVEYFNGTSWLSAAGSVTSVGLTMPTIFNVGGSPVTSSGVLVVALANQANNTVFAGPVLPTSSAQPTFRTLSLLASDMSDVVITSPAANQVLTYSSGTAKWVNTTAAAAAATGQVGVSFAGGGTAWTLVSGTQYTANFVHNLGTTNVVITLYDTNDNSVVIAQSLTVTDANTVKVNVIGNSKTIKVVVVANGLAIAAGGSTPSSVITQLNGTVIATASTTLNFTGQAVNMTAAGNTTTISIGSRFTFFANSLDSPNNSDYAVNALAPVVTDPTYTSLNVRQFSNTVEQGVGFLVSVPTGATTITFKIRGRSQTTPGVASVVQPRAYYRLLGNNTAVAAWTGPLDLNNIAIPTNTNFQYFQQSSSIAAAGIVAGSTYQFELTRRVAGVTGTNLAANFLLVEVTVEFA